MKRWTRRRLIGASLLATAGLTFGLLLSGAGRGIALYAYLLLVALIAVVSVGSRIGSAWPATPRFDTLVPRRSEPEPRVLQLEGLVGRLGGGNPNDFELHQRIRPLVREIVAAELSRAHGVDLEQRPERAEQLLGPRTWRLIRPGAEPPRDAWDRSWSPRDLSELVSELEGLR